MRGPFAGDPEAEAGGEESPGHIGEGEEEEAAAAEGIDCPDGWKGEEPGGRVSEVL